MKIKYIFLSYVILAHIITVAETWQSHCSFDHISFFLLTVYDYFVVVIGLKSEDMKTKASHKIFPLIFLSSSTLKKFLEQTQLILQDFSDQKFTHLEIFPLLLLISQDFSADLLASRWHHITSYLMRWCICENGLSYVYQTNNMT